jgi:coenzyme PQQ precursor peptide PqqA
MKIMRPRCARCARREAAAREECYGQEAPMSWTKPEYTEMRFGFEVTMYIASR